MPLKLNEFNIVKSEKKICNSKVGFARNLVKS